MATLSDLIPGLREAEDRYRETNAEAFLNVEPKICGMVEILPFTPQMYLELDAGENAFFAKAGTSIAEADVAVFLWRCSPYYVRGNEDLRRLFIGTLAVLPYQKAVDEITAYIRRSWSGMPLWPGKKSAEVALAQWPSRLVHIFAREYGWLEEYTLNRPFRRLWQYANRILEEHDPKYREQCDEVMRLRQDWLKEQNNPSRN